jgi:hypothetical protein
MGSYNFGISIDIGMCDGVCMFMLLRIRHRLLFLFIFPSLLLVGVHPKFICLSRLSLGSFFLDRPP